MISINGTVQLFDESLSDIEKCQLIHSLTLKRIEGTPEQKEALTVLVSDFGFGLYKTIEDIEISRDLIISDKEAFCFDHNISDEDIHLVYSAMIDTLDFTSGNQIFAEVIEGTVDSLTPRLAS